MEFPFLAVKTRWIIPNSLDKTSCLLRGGCAANFYQASECISTGFEKGQGVKAPHQNKGNSRKTAELPPPPRQAGARGSAGRDKPLCLPVDKCFPLLASWCSGSPASPTTHPSTPLCDCPPSPSQASSYLWVPRLPLLGLHPSCVVQG